MQGSPPTPPQAYPKGPSPSHPKAQESPFISTVCPISARRCSFQLPNPSPAWTRLPIARPASGQALRREVGCIVSRMPVPHIQHFGHHSTSRGSQQPSANFKNCPLYRLENQGPENLCLPRPPAYQALSFFTTLCWKLVFRPLPPLSILWPGDITMFPQALDK